ncbi:preprotein translocase [Methanosarcina sp. 2.H.T.1A.6]|uniref:Sec-independent protein translocase subunit TatA/TatB n=1 Tax=unclassified Methanosarcina TaxID=2644672 RepID=UPI000621F1D6|nr:MULTISPECIES: twin-arginine translocase TatA/TatE family subunit [unclassified Methanosarcina]KKG17017.1 preprotein translocase [Methanosarcina sp. 2.H.T.1A.3]KKG20359.1 preprotein translocase [Methanosarcina sp. 2.H.T.1A.6]KKG23376.1 preprotein translocase [Methanosarcina sp. 2.H.T.1A.8]KKG26836.1 preprotein translocase [Methanosarcina sp. 2.H.T.1A.15]
MIGSTEVLAILIAALFLFGPRKLPELARSLGSAVGEFKKAQRAAELELTTFDSYTRKPEYGAVPGVKEDEKDIKNEAPKTKIGTDKSLKNSLEARSSIPDIENQEASGTNGKIPE